LSNSRFPKLMEPGQIGKIKTKNRFIKSANGTSFIDPTGFVGDRAIAYYEAMANGGVGLLIVESCGVEFPLACQHVEAQFRLSDDKYIPSYAELAKAVHEQGCPIMIQFQHAGPWNPTGLLPKRDTKAASALTQEELPGPDFAVPRAMSHDEVREMVEVWVKAGERAQKAGFDGVEINGGTCHQINTFLSRIWNRREDEYGPQSLENRARYMSEIVRETKKRCGPDFTVTCLLNIREFNHPRATTIDEGVGLARLLQQAGADAIQCRAHIYGHREGLLHPDRLLYPEEPKWLHTEVKELDWSHKGRGAIVPLAAAVKKEVTVPVYCAGRLDAELGEKFLREGKIDFVPMVRRLLADPELPNKVMSGKLEDIRPCSGCLHCMDVRNRNKRLECRVNSNLGHEKEYVIKPALKKKKVMVVGGGPAGMEAALIAARRGHKVTLCEKSARLGGLLPIAAIMKDLETNDLLALISYYRNQLAKEGVSLRMKQEITPELIKQIDPEVVILANGGAPGLPDIPGIDNPRVASNIALHKQLTSLLRYFRPQTLGWLTRLWMPVGRKVVIIGGAIHGCELAEFLVKRGRSVTIVHSGDKLGSGMTTDDQLRLFPWFKEKGVVSYTGVKYEEINDQGLVITSANGEKLTLGADTIIPSLYIKQDLKLEAELAKIIPEVYTVGSYIEREPDLIVDAIAAGAAIAHRI
jgi:2,4-dienoyl-CoA reductase (NADPH2)